MRLLLDTSVFVKLTLAPNAVPKRIRDAIDTADARVLSVASAWEISIKTALGKLDLPLGCDEWIRTRTSRMLISVENVRLEHATAVENLPHHHKDPFDRLLVAQAVIDGFTLVTDDRVLKKYAVKLLPAW